MGSAIHADPDGRGQAVPPQCGSSWFADETYVKVSGSWRYVYRAIDQKGQVIDVFVSKKRDLRAATIFFTSVITAHGQPAETTTDRAHALVRVVRELLP